MTDEDRQATAGGPTTASLMLEALETVEGLPEQVREPLVALASEEAGDRAANIKRLIEEAADG